MMKVRSLCLITVQSFRALQLRGEFMNVKQDAAEKRGK